jgi:hypothetical protein
MAIDQGNLIIEGNCVINSSTANAAAFELSSNVSTLIKSGATMKFTGPVIYN